MRRKNGNSINKILKEKTLSKIFFHIGMAIGFEFPDVFLINLNYSYKGHLPYRDFYYKLFFGFEKYEIIR